MKVACLDDDNNIINIIEVKDLNSIPDYIGVDKNKKLVHKNKVAKFVDMSSVKPDPDNVYAWIDDKGNLQTHNIPELAPKKAVKITKYGHSKLSPNFLITIDNGTITQNTEEQVLQNLQKQKLQQLDKYVSLLLQPTDYIIIKIAEAQTVNDSQLLQSLQVKYATQLQYRQSVRDWSDKMKQTINNCTTIEQINATVIEYQGA
jgi:hypothetical protein